ncbi:DEAD/DEAH box helicase [Roseibium sp. CAU 1637]|uniref:DEAD/DEAH box helicase n=1 Tax=Roseibium limicola TaxID=2816037 RepID=A0A939EQ74_9HYPH|nr:DEAD/DEAH box helicase [Roseibium limicola]MBO0345946.1 DEAD/DEAH box helicase [Roseibium limicola]
MTDFKSLGLSDVLLSAVAESGYESPTPIQEKAIPLVLEGRDLMGLAQTGTGKTAAFGLPLVQRLLDLDVRPEPCGARALILAPTRELVNQIAKTLVSYVRKTPIRVTSVVGGVSINAQMKRMSRGTDILVATPGRLLDLVDRNAVRLHTANFLVLDEADQMLDLGFIHSLRRIAGLVAKQRQTLLFSATMPKQINELASTYLRDPLRVEVAPVGKTADKITQSVHFMDQGAKTDAVITMLSENPNDLSLVFCRTKHGAEKLMRKMVQAGLKAASIHGNKSQNQRERAIKALRDGEVRILVATDVAARGIDIPGVSHVYNFEMPEVPEAYVHRIGRTARAGADGDAVALCAPGEIGYFRQIERLTGLSIPVASGIVPPDSAAEKPSRGGRKGGGGGRSGGGNGRGQQRSSGGDKGQQNKSGRSSGPKKAFGESQGQKPDARRRRPRRERAAA